MVFLVFPEAPFEQVRSIHQPSPAPILETPRKDPALLLEERVGIKIHTDDIHRWVMQIEVAGVDTHDEGHGGTQHVCQHQWAERNVGALPVQREDHLKHRRVRTSEQGTGRRQRRGQRP